LLKRIFVLFVFAIFCLCGLSTQSQTGSAITIKDAWIQQGPPSQKNTAGFMIVENHSGKEIALISAKSDICNVVELHKMETVNEMMRMKKVDQVVVPANGQAEFKPGGYHLMIIGLNRALKEGEDIEVKLQFTSNIEKTIHMQVKNRESMN